MASIHVGMPPDLIADLDDFVEESEFADRSKAVQHAVETMLEDREARDGDD